ncbi:MAG: YicC/YloC family endoribonuclease [Alphaproteobacteria bacterium]
MGEDPVTIASMTGFARADGRNGAYNWTWEVRSVNGRSLDTRSRLPSGMDWLDPLAREAIAKRFRRGHLSVALSLTRSPGRLQVHLNRELLGELIAAIDELGAERSFAPPRLDSLLAIRGIVEVTEEEEGEAEREAREGALAQSLNDALDDLGAARRQEGERLVSVLLEQIDGAVALLESAKRTAALQPDAIRQRLSEQVARLLDAQPSLPDERLAQEAALLATRADVREELDRLASHMSATREIIAEGESGEGAFPIGRRLDFLAQEAHREANTLCSKSTDVELTRIGLDLKALIDQFREQVQNIE